MPPFRSEHGDLIREAREVAEDLRFWQPKPGEWASGGVHANNQRADVIDRLIVALEARPSLVVQSEEALAAGIAARLAWASLHWEVSTPDMHMEVARALIESGVVQVADATCKEGGAGMTAQEHIDHAAEARRYLPKRREGILPNHVAVAQAHATLALVEQQRIANLIALAQHSGPLDDAMRDLYDEALDGLTIRKGDDR